MINQRLRGEEKRRKGGVLGDLRRVSERRVTRVNGARSRFGAGCGERQGAREEDLITGVRFLP